MEVYWSRGHEHHAPEEEDESEDEELEEELIPSKRHQRYIMAYYLTRV